MPPSPADDVVEPEADAWVHPVGCGAELINTHQPQQAASQQPHLIIQGSVQGQQVDQQAHKRQRRTAHPILQTNRAGQQQ